MDDVSLTTGPIPVALLVLGAVGLLGLLMRRGLRPWLLIVLVGGIAALVAFFGMNGLLLGLGLGTSELPTQVLIWMAVAVGAVGLTVANLFFSSWRRVAVVVACGALVLITASSQINIYFQKYQTLADLAGASVDDVNPLGDTGVAGGSAVETTPVIDRWNGSATSPEGVVQSAPIPGTVSGFLGRDAYIYTPPAYHAPDAPRLPVLVLVSGQPGGPSDWVVSGRLRQNLDMFAARHNGLAPVTVVVDPNGSDSANTMCMDSAIERTETYMAKDVPDWIISRLRVDANFDHWAIGGWSFGGTCALQMATRKPDIYPSFIDFQGEREPAISADRSVTVNTAFGGNVAAFDAQTPLRALATTSYPESWGFFAAGGTDAVFVGFMNEVSAAARRAGMHVSTVVVPGQGHSWGVPITQLVPALEWLSPKLGLSRGP